MSAILQTTIARTRPRLVFIAACTTALNVIRLVAIAYIVAATTGSVPPIAYIPGVGDFLSGLTALLITFALLRRNAGINTWGTALVWHSFAMADVIVALALTFLAPTAGFGPSIFLVLPFTFLTAHIVSFILLTRRSAKDYFLHI